MNLKWTRTRQIWLGLSLSGLFLWLLTETLPWGHQFDLWFAHLLYNEHTQQFILGHEGWVERYFHDIPQYMLRALGGYILIHVLYGFCLKQTTGLNATQHEVWLRWLGFFVGAVACVLAVSLIKGKTNVACPWDLQEFGGAWPYVDLFTARPWAPKVIKCWPAGHGGAGMSIVAVAFVMGWPPAMWRASLKTGDDQMPDYLSAKCFVWYALILSVLLGGVRILQGGHFISHHVWAIWWDVLVIMIVLELGIIKKRWVNRPVR